MNRTQSPSAIAMLQSFLKLESAGGILLVSATVVALLLANIPTAQEAYDWFLGLQLTVTLGGLGVDKPLLLWINDALMVLFFMLIGLELKREVVEGQLSSPDQVIMPALAAVGGWSSPLPYSGSSTRTSSHRRMVGRSRPRLTLPLRLRCLA